MNNDNFNNLDTNLHGAGLKQLKENANWYLLLGIALIVLGGFALAFSVYTTIFSVIYLGIFMIIVGFFQAVKSFKISKWGSFLLHLLLGALYVAAGFFITFNPLVNAVSLTLLLAVFFLISGILKIFFSFMPNTLHRFWVAISGILSIALAVLIWAQWPISGLWVIGTFVAIDTIFTGLTWVMLALNANKIQA